MASPLKPEFFGATLRCVLPSTVDEISVEADLYSQWKEWMLYGDNSKYPPLFRTVGGDPLTPGIDAGAYFFWQNQYGWRLRPAEEDATVLISGNLAPEDSTLPIAVPTLGAFTVLLLGLQPITQSVEEILLQGQDASYRGIVHLDQAGGTSGTAYPIGLPDMPVNNIADAKTILARVGGNQIELDNGTTTLDENIEGYRIIGGQSVTSIVLDMNGFSVDTSYIEGCFIQGDQGGTIAGFEAYKCGFQVVTNLAVGAERCTFFSSVSLKPGSNNIWIACNSGVPGTGSPIIDCDGALFWQARPWIGGIKFENMNNEAFVASLDIAPGTVKILDGVGNTAGIINIRGHGTKEIGDAMLAGQTAGSPQNVTQIVDRMFDTQELQTMIEGVIGNTDVSLDDLTVTLLNKNLDTLRSLSVSADGRQRRIL